MERATVAIYEAHARAWQRARPTVGLELARAFASRVRAGGLRVDLGCGPGRYAPELGHPLVALDAARAMLDLAAERVDRALLVQADLEALPFRDRSLGGAWASMSYVHVPRVRLPLALARLHWALEPGAPLELVLLAGELEGPFPDDDFPGRFFCAWQRHNLTDVVAGAGFDVDSVEPEENRIRVRARRARSIPDTVGPAMRVLVCGLNPSLYAADRGIGYARPGNRFWPAAIAAGLVSRDRDPLHALAAHGIGMTDLVKRPSASAAELAAAEYRAGAARLERLVAWFGPRVVCFVGLDGWRAAVDAGAAPGLQPRAFGGVPAYVMPSTSGANARTRPDDLVAHLRRVARLGATSARPAGAGPAGAERATGAGGGADWATGGADSAAQPQLTLRSRPSQ